MLFHKAHRGTECHDCMLPNNYRRFRKKQYQSVIRIILINTIATVFELIPSAPFNEGIGEVVVIIQLAVNSIVLSEEITIVASPLNGGSASK